MFNLNMSGVTAETISVFCLVRAWNRDTYLDTVLTLSLRLSDSAQHSSSVTVNIF